jgi:hypothetical protein
MANPLLFYLLFIFMYKFKLTSPSLSIYSIHLSSLLSILARFIVLFTFFFVYAIFFLFVFGFNLQWLLSFNYFAFAVPFILVSFLYGRLKIHVPYSVLSSTRNHTSKRVFLFPAAFRSFAVINGYYLK